MNHVAEINNKHKQNRSKMLIDPADRAEEMARQFVEQSKKIDESTEAKSEAEELARKSLPSPLTHGKYEKRFGQLIVEIMTGRPTEIPPQMIKMPEQIYEPITLVLSSSGEFYYRVTPTHCPCQGWYWSKQRYGIGKCRHHTSAYPHLARLNEKEMARIKAERKAKAGTAKAKGKAQSTEPFNPKEVLEQVKAALEERGLKVSSVKVGMCDSISIKIPFKDECTADDEAQKDLILQTAMAAAPGVKISLSM